MLGILSSRSRYCQGRHIVPTALLIRMLSFMNICAMLQKSGIGTIVSSMTFGPKCQRRMRLITLLLFLNPMGWILGVFDYPQFAY